MLSTLDGEAAKSAAPVRPRHQMTRSVTEVSASSFPKLHRPHHHPHLHRREKDDKNTQPNHLTIQSAQPNDISKSEAVTPNESRNVSRRPSILDIKDGFDANNARMAVSGNTKERRIVTEEELSIEKEKAALRATELRNALTELNKASNDATRRLDISYYAVLEKVSTLQSMVLSLKELAAVTKGLDSDFKTDSEEVVREFESQIALYGDFSDQNHKIRALEERVRYSRAKIKSLGERVDLVNQRVGYWEKAEVEWQERARTRLRILWAIMAMFATVLVILVVS